MTRKAIPVAKTVRPLTRPSKRIVDTSALERTRLALIRAGHLAEMYPVEVMVLAGRGAAMHVNRKTRSVLLGALESFALAVDEAMSGDASAVDRIQAMRDAANPGQYRTAESLCERYLVKPTVALLPWDGAPHVVLREDELIAMLARLVDPAFDLLCSDDVVRADERSRSAGDLACRLIVKANAIAPRTKGESAEKHEARIRRGLNQARSKANVRSARPRG